MRQANRKLYNFTCPCSVKFELFLTEREVASPKRRKHCTRKCAGHFRSVSEATRKKTSESLRGRPSPRKSTTRIDRGFDFNCDYCGIVQRAHGKRGRQKNRFCSIECYKTFHAAHRSSREAYKYACQFTFNVYLYPEHFDLGLLKEHGWYSASNRGGNLNGVSRDHIVSISDGFKLGIDPAMIAHPANCRLIRHTENQRKNSRSMITVEELQQRIIQFTSRYPSS